MRTHVKPAVQWLIGWGLCLVVLATFHFVLVARRERALVHSRRQSATQAQQFSLLKNAKSAREQQRIQAELDELDRRYGDFVFSNDELNGLDLQIRGIAEKNGLSDFSSRHVATTTTIGTTKLQRIAQREMVFSFSCGFPEFLHFVNDLERHQPILFVKQFTLRNVVGKDTGLSCDMECSVLYQATGP